MFQHVSIVALVAMAVGSLAMASAEEPQEAGGKTKGPPQELTFHLGKGVKLEMVLIPAGEFKMGSPDSDKDAFDIEQPQHKVRITKPFYLGKYPCRAGSTTRYYFGNDESELDDYAWHLANSGDRPRPPGQKKPNAWGLYDMHGNAGE